ncbi:MAG: hypothetical protein EOO42_01135 [Flavobacteriales bacterium]|nr:MAG: hypothetical protein EOO42_01135 [Flavobacteriales bacterium]
MELYTFGLATLKMGGIDAATGLPTGLADVGSVYKDSVAYTGGDVTKTPIYSQQKPNTPVKEFKSKASGSFVFNLMSTEVAKLALFGVGEVVTLNSVSVLGINDDPVDLEKSFEMTTTDGTVLTILRGSITAKENWTVSDQGIWLTEISVTPLVPKIAGLKSVTVKNPA